MGFDNADLSIGDDVMVESELNDDYSIEDVEDGGEPEDDSFAMDDLFADDADGEED